MFEEMWIARAFMLDFHSDIFAQSTKISQFYPSEHSGMTLQHQISVLSLIPQLQILSARLLPIQLFQSPHSDASGAI
jgi:hypothetical protein